MKGTRKYVDETEELWLDGGEYGQDSRGVWMARPPGGHLGDLSNHDVTEHEDGTITVSPSILITGEGGSWHGYLERGVWTKV
ncbi:hypothetical protein LCGC14_1863900 [marine sediment metagenome]|uniref:Uncharacterized protein n=1 Tax=marine sediment metagenome TaxID=412755 RepID=A0A0F9J5N6_9ZZZZ